MKTGPKPRSTEEVRKIIQSYGCDLIGEYTSWKDKLQIQCLCGHMRLMRMDKFLSPKDTHLCRNCCGARNCGLSTEYVRGVIESLGCELVGEYRGAKEKIQVRCPCGNIRLVKFHAFIRPNVYHLCEECSPHPKDKTSDEIRIGFENKGFRFIDDKNILGINTKVNIIDKEGYKYYANYSQLYDRKDKNKITLKKFYYSNPFVLENMNLWAKKGNKKIKILNSWLENGTLMVKSICQNCKTEWNSVWLSVFYGHLCGHCSKMGGKIKGGEDTFAFMHPELLKEWDYNKNILEPEFYSKSSAQKVWWICSSCEHKWKAEIRSRSNGHGCPACSSPKGEKRVKKFFENNEIEFCPQYMFSDCINLRELRFDFAIFDNGKLSFLCEVQGRQHYEIVKFFDGEEGFRKRQINDSIKEQYCLSHNIPLLKIPYWDFNKIPEILISYLHL
jgi:hypothetical protein